MDNRTDHRHTSGPLRLLKVQSQFGLSKQQLLLCNSCRFLAILAGYLWFLHVTELDSIRQVCLSVHSNDCFANDERLCIS